MAENIELIEIKYKSLSATISTLGAELQSLKIYGREYLWPGDPNFWKGRAPVLFPICGALKDGYYCLGGKQYEMPKHGFARNSVFTAKKLASNRAVFSLKHSDKTLEFYPFEFELQVTFRLKAYSLEVEYAFFNNSEKKAFLSLGSHEALILDSGVENYSLQFDGARDIMHSVLDGNGLINGQKILLAQDSDTLPLSEELFNLDTIIMRGVTDKRVWLAKNGEKIIRLDYDAPNLLVWKAKNSRFICIEPWFNIPDISECDHDIEKKEGLVWLPPRSCFINKHEITIIELLNNRMHHIVQR